MRRVSALLLLLLALSVGSCACSTELGGGASRSAATPSPTSRSSTPATGAADVVARAAPAPSPGCRDGRALTVHFYDVGQALAALVDLPDGRHLLVDAGDSPHRAGCAACEAEHAHLQAALRRDLGGAPIDLLWNTHPHSDHVGGVAAVIDDFRVLAYVDNGRGDGKPEVRAARETAARRGVLYVRVDPETVSAAAPLLASFPVRPILPPSWPGSCARDENECSIGLRIDFCGSSVLFTGDAEHEEEAQLDALGPATLLQVGHHGSDTSSSARFLAKVAPMYAVVSAGHPDDDRNREYCHPRALAMRRLSRALVSTGGGGENARLEAYEGPCKEGATSAARARGWVDLPVSGRLFATERDGDVVLTTTGDGTFARPSSAYR